MLMDTITLLDSAAGGNCIKSHRKSEGSKPIDNITDILQAEYRRQLLLIDLHSKRLSGVASN